MKYVLASVAFFALMFVGHSGKSKGIDYTVEVWFGGIPFKVKGNLTLLAKTKKGQQLVELNSKNPETYAKGGSAKYTSALKYPLDKIKEIGLTFNDTDKKVMSTIYIRSVVLEYVKAPLMVFKKKKQFCVQKEKGALTESQELLLNPANCEQNS